MSPRSFRRHCRFRHFTANLLQRIDLFAVQTIAYASHFRALGVAQERIAVTGSVKYDGVTMDRQNAKTREMAKLFGIDNNDLVFVAGSTQDPEEEVAIAAWEACRKDYPSLRLILVPRQKDRFDAVANLLEKQNKQFVRRSELKEPLKDRDSIVLVDTIGELNAVWGLSQIAFVGGSLDGRRGGQNMIEPAAYGSAVIFGPHVWNFRETATRLVEAKAAVQLPDGDALEVITRRLLADPLGGSGPNSGARALPGTGQEPPARGRQMRTLVCLDSLISDDRTAMNSPPDTSGLRTKSPIRANPCLFLKGQFVPFSQAKLPLYDAGLVFEAMLHRHRFHSGPSVAALPAPRSPRTLLHQAVGLPRFPWRAASRTLQRRSRRNW